MAAALQYGAAPLTRIISRSPSILIALGNNQELHRFEATFPLSVVQTLAITANPIGAVC